jgi:hypothetical protein
MTRQDSRDTIQPNGSSQQFTCRHTLRNHIRPPRLTQPVGYWRYIAPENILDAEREVQAGESSLSEFNQPNLPPAHDSDCHRIILYHTCWSHCVRHPSCFDQVLCRNPSGGSPWIRNNVDLIMHINTSTRVATMIVVFIERHIVSKTCINERQHTKKDRKKYK